MRILVETYVRSEDATKISHHVEREAHQVQNGLHGFFMRDDILLLGSATHVEAHLKV